MRGRQRAPRRPTPAEDERSWFGVVVWWAGAVLGAVSALGALVFGLYAFAYADQGVAFGGYRYGCDDQACVMMHVLASWLSFGSIALYAILLALAPFTSVRALRASARLGLVWAIAVSTLGLISGWPGLAILAPAPALMAGGSWLRLRAKRGQARA